MNFEGQTPLFLSLMSRKMAITLDDDDDYMQILKLYLQDEENLKNHEKEILYNLLLLRKIHRQEETREENLVT